MTSVLFKKKEKIYTRYLVFKEKREKLLNFLKKKDSLSIPTTIKVYNFSNPSIKVTNQMVDLEIRGMEEPQGYISLGGALPARLSHFKKISGLNFYVNAPSFNTKELNAISFKPNVIDWIFQITNSDRSNNLCLRY